MGWVNLALTPEEQEKAEPTDLLDYLGVHDEFWPVNLVVRGKVLLIVPEKWLDQQHQEALMEDERRDALPVQ